MNTKITTARYLRTDYMCLLILKRHNVSESFPHKIISSSYVHNIHTHSTTAVAHMMLSSAMALMRMVMGGAMDLRDWNA